MDFQAISNATPSGYRDLPPEGAAPNLASFRLIDVREPDEFNGPLGHIEGAELVPMGGFPTAADAWDRSQRLLVICRSGNRSGRVASILTKSGFTNVYNLIGGMLVWNELGLPVVRP
jgi:rhodanese-related sulfurtransferase